MTLSQFLMSVLVPGLLLVPPAPLPPSGPDPPVTPAPVVPGPRSPAAVRPVPGPLLHGFDPPAEAWGSGHRGVDLAAAPGDPVLAALPGVIRFAGVLAGRGVVTVDHGGRRTTYEPVTAWVRVGDEVAAGDALGALEPTPGHCYPTGCLHWGLLEGDLYLDPLTLLGPRKVRLLPLLD